MQEIKAIELTKESFKDYGYIMTNAEGEPLLKNIEFTYWGGISNFKIDSNISTGILYVHDRPLALTKLERHINSPEVLIALEGDSLICLGKPKIKDFCSNIIDDIKAFYIKKGDAVVLHSGTWHWAPFPYKYETSKYLVLLANGTEGNDVEVRDLHEEIRILA